MEALVFFFPLLFAAIVFTIIFSVSKRQMERIRKNFFILSEKLNLQLSVPEQNFWSQLFFRKYPELQGSFEERFKIRIYMFDRGGGKSKKTYTAFSLFCENPRQQTMTIFREGFFQKIGKAMGMQRDIELRDEDFDKRFILKSPDSLFVKELFADPDFREYFIKYDYAFAEGRLRLLHNSLEFERMGIVASEFERKRLVVALRLAAKLAERLEQIG